MGRGSLRSGGELLIRFCRAHDDGGYSSGGWIREWIDDESCKSSVLSAIGEKS